MSRAAMPMRVETQNPNIQRRSSVQPLLQFGVEASKVQVVQFDQLIGHILAQDLVETLGQPGGHRHATLQSSSR
jgi:hypothetical protein